METKQVEFNGETLTVLAETDMTMFRLLDDDEKKDFRKDAKDFANKLKSGFHPILQDEILKLKRDEEQC